MSRIKHRRLYKKIPEFRCKDGCNECCGPVPLTDWEAKRLGVKGNMTPTKEGSLTCIFSTKNGCKVYDKRPFMCRLFGTAKESRLECPKGCGPKTPLTDAQAASITTEYLKLKTGE